MNRRQLANEWMLINSSDIELTSVPVACCIFFPRHLYIVTPEKEQSHSPCHVKLMGDIFLLPNYRNHRKYTQIQFGKNQSRIDCITSFFRLPLLVYHTNSCNISHPSGLIHICPEPTVTSMVMRFSYF